jgi:hypothetical protein
MVKLDITVNNDALLKLQSALASCGAGSMPATAAAVKTGADIVRGSWMGFAMGGSLQGIESLKRPSGTYARSIKIQRNGPFNYEIYSEAKVAEWIEHGTEELDMKTTHPYGPRSRVTKSGKNKGVPYLIIPFRWGTPGAIGFKNIIPEQVYNIVKNKKKFEKSTVLMTTHNEPNYSGRPVTRSEYDWGERFTPGDGEQYFDSEKDITDRLSGMVSMDGENSSGKKISSGYFTFRIISAASPKGSWIKPAMRARPVTQAVANFTRGTINDIVEGAVMEDLGL